MGHSICTLGTCGIPLTQSLFYLVPCMLERPSQGKYEQMNSNLFMNRWWTCTRACSPPYPVTPIRYITPSDGSVLEAARPRPLALFPSATAPMSVHSPSTSDPKVIEEGNASINQAAQSQDPRADRWSQIRKDIYAAFFELIGTVESSPACDPVVGIDNQVDHRQPLLCSPWAVFRVRLSIRPPLV